MKRYELKKIADGGLLYLEESDFVDVRPRKGDQLYPVEVELRNRDAYTAEDGFHYNARSKTVTIRLSARQAKELIEQDRAATGKDFCEGCFDFGTSTDPETCARCNVIRSMHLAGWGDLRKVRIPIPAPTSYALPVALLLAVLAFWWALCQWSGAAAERDQARQELAGCRRPPPSKR